MEVYHRFGGSRHPMVMEIEQPAGKSVHFGFIVALFAAAIVIILGLGVLLLRWDGSKLVPRHRSQHPTSQVMGVERVWVG